MRLFFIFFFLLCGAGAEMWAAGPELPPAPRELRIISYNTYNFQPLSRPQVKSPESRKMVAEIIASLSPEIAVLIEVGGREGLQELLALLKEKKTDYPFSSVVEGQDPERRIAIIARFTPQLVAHETSSTYNLKGQEVRVQRGFAHLVFAFANGYRLHLVAAHLKSKMFDRLGQTDMRRYEARLLRYLVNEIQEKEPQANILVAGDFNDSPDSSPLNTLYNRRAQEAKQLFDLRPGDSHGLCWTYLYDPGDSYSRIDYLLASLALLPEVDFSKTRIPEIADWYIASDHRPVLVTLQPADQPYDPAILKQFDRNMRRLEIPASFFHEGRVLGTRKAQKGVEPDAGETGGGDADSP